MNQELQSKLVEILTSIQAATGKAADFTIAQLPDIAQSYVAYGRAAATIYVGLSLIAFSLCVWAALRFGYLNKSAVKNDEYYKGDWKEQRVFAAMAGTFAAVMCLIPAITNASDLLMVWLAPKVWLLRELAHLVR